jgi:hypothetical protein
MLPVMFPPPTRFAVLGFRRRKLYPASSVDALAMSVRDMQSPA